MKPHPLLNVRLGAGALLFAVQLSFGQIAPPVPIAPGGPAYAPGEVLIQFKANVTDPQVGAAFQLAGLGLIKHIRTPAMEAHGQIGLTRAATATPVPVAVEVLNRLPGVEFAEPNWVYAHQSASPPNDPCFLNWGLWGMYGDIDPFTPPSASRVNPYGSQAVKAWAAGYTGSGATYVGVIDTGVQVNHPDLAANIWTNPGEIPGNGKDDDGNGYVDDIHGWDFFSNDNSVFDGTDDYHGTHVSGTIGAAGNNQLGVVGVSWDVAIIPAKFLGPDGGSTADAIEAVDYFTNLKQNLEVNIVALNNSWGGGGFSQGLLDAIARAAQQDILFVAAAGNAASDIDAAPFYPASYDTTAGAGFNSVIAVAATQSDGALAGFSNYGRNAVHLAAPGSVVLSTVPYATPRVMLDAGEYLAGPLQNAASGAVTAELVDGGKGLAMNPDWAGKVVLVERGDGTFFTKVMNVQNSGGLAAVIYSDVPNTTPGGFYGTLGDGNSSAIPAVSVAREDGLVMLTKLGLPATVDSPAPLTPGSGYARLSGTSMATPHVTGAIALYASAHPGATLQQIRYDLVTAGAYPLPSLAGIIASGGTLDVWSFLDAPISGNPRPVALPNAPSSLTAKALNVGKGADLTWKDNSSNESGFKVERRIGGSGVWQILATLLPNATKYTDASAPRRSTLTYRVRAINVVGSSAYSNEASVKTK